MSEVNLGFSYMMAQVDSVTIRYYCETRQACVDLGNTDFSVGNTGKYPNFQLVIVKNLIFSCSEKDRSLGHIILFPPMLVQGGFLTGPP